MAVERTVEFVTEVMQDSYHTTGEGTTGKIRINPRGEIVVPDFYQQLVFDGRVFMASNAARETAEAIGSVDSFSDTDPALLLDVPTGTTVMPLEIILNQGGTVAGGVITVLITLSDKIRYASDGAAITPQNLRFDEPRSSACSFYSGSTDIVAAANTDDLTLYAAILDQDVATAPNATATKINWTAREFIAPVLVGPAALVIYAVAATTQPSFFYSVKWAELATTDVT
jgi:hypothetical protein